MINKFVAFITRSFYITRALTLSIIVMVVLIALEDSLPTPFETIVIILWTVLCLNLTRAFSELIAEIVEKRRTLTSDERTTYFKEIVFIPLELAPLIIVFTISWIGIIDIKTAFLSAKVIMLIILFLYGFVGIKLTGRNILLSILGGLLISLLGGSIILLRLLFN